MNEHRINSLDLQTKVYSVKELRFTPQGSAVCNARIKHSGKLDEEWRAGWIGLVAWDDAADILASCEHGGEVIIRGARVKLNPYRNRAGEVVDEVQYHTNKIERVGSFDAGQPARSAPAGDPNDVPF